MSRMRNLILAILLLTFGLLSCQQNQKNEKDSEICWERRDISTNQSYLYKIAENISLESLIPTPILNLDSTESYYYYANGGIYSFIKDDEGRIFFSALIAEMSPALFVEGIYPDYENAKLRYFIYNDTHVSNKNRNRIFAGTLLTQSHQVKVQDYIDAFRSACTVSSQILTPNSIIFILELDQ